MVEVIDPNSFSYFSDLDAPSPQCPICYTDQQSIFIVHNSADGKLHPYHQSCLFRWLNQPGVNKSCPICRIALDKTKLPEEIFNQVQNNVTFKQLINKKITSACDAVKNTFYDSPVTFIILAIPVSIVVISFFRTFIFKALNIKTSPLHTLPLQDVPKAISAHKSSLSSKEPWKTNLHLIHFILPAQLLKTITFKATEFFAPILNRAIFLDSNVFSKSLLLNTITIIFTDLIFYSKTNTLNRASLMLTATFVGVAMDYAAVKLNFVYDKLFHHSLFSKELSVSIRSSNKIAKPFQQVTPQKLKDNSKKIPNDFSEILAVRATFQNPTRPFIVNYILSAAHFAKAFCFNTIRSVKFIALSLFSVFRISTHEGKSYFIENISRALTNLKGSCVALIGMPFPFFINLI